MKKKMLAMAMAAIMAVGVLSGCSSKVDETTGDTAASDTAVTEASAEVSGGKKKATWDKGEKKLKFSYKEQKEFETIDDDIAALEQKIEELDAEMAVHASQYSRLAELTEEKEKVQAELDEKMERWMYLTELNEKIEAQK